MQTNTLQKAITLKGEGSSGKVYMVLNYENG